MEERFSEVERKWLSGIRKMADGISAELKESYQASQKEDARKNAVILSYIFQGYPTMTVEVRPHGIESSWRQAVVQIERIYELVLWDIDSLEEAIPAIVYHLRKVRLASS